MSPQAATITFSTLTPSAVDEGALVVAELTLFVALLTVDRHEVCGIYWFCFVVARDYFNSVSNHYLEL
jgi:hypothetical protein